VDFLILNIFINSTNVLLNSEMKIMKRLRFKNQPSTNTWKDISNTSTKKWMLPLIIILAILVIGMGNVWGQACATGGVNKGTLSFVILAKHCSYGFWSIDLLAIFSSCWCYVFIQ
jgi:hypothetical protein